MNRKMRRVQASMQRKSAAPAVGEGVAELAQEFRNMQVQLVKMVEFNKSLMRSMQVLKETLERKGVLTREDVKDTEVLYRETSKNRDAKVKELVGSTMSDFDKIEWCVKEAEAEKHGYERYSIQPVRDLNIAPGIVNDYLLDKGYSGEKYQRYATYLGVPESMLVRMAVEAGQQQAGVMG